MIQGRKKEELLKVDDILSLTNGGYDIYMHYLGKVARVMDRPWGKKERKSSWGVYPYKGTWLWKDQATEETGNAIQFAERYLGLDFNAARDRVIWEFGLAKKGVIINPTPVVRNWDNPIDDEGYVRINFDDMPFEKRHHLFWNAACVTEQHCREKSCYAVKRLAVKGRYVHLSPGEAVFAYYCEEEGAVKIYFADREKGEKFRNNVSYHHLWNYDKVERCENLIVQKSNKDMIVTTMVTPCCINTQAEAVKIFNEEVVSRINRITTTPWVWYGSDWDGVKKCKQITDTNGWRYINTEKKYLPDVNDTYGIVRMWETEKKGSGLVKLEEFMKRKKLL